jgi:hypothetical protein
MKPLNLDQVREFVNANIVRFHDRRIHSLETLELGDLLRKKNPYLFRAKNLTVASDLIKELLGAFLSSSEEKLFGDFLEDLAIYIAGHTCDGHKSAATGIDLEFSYGGVHYLVAIKSGPSWGNSSQHSKQEQDFKNAVTRLKQSQHGVNAQPILGICYGKARTGPFRGVGYKLVGQNFWYLISEQESLYTDIIDPIGYQAKQHNDRYFEERDRVINQFTRQFIDRFCDRSGLVDWLKLVEHNSANFDLQQWYPRQ